MRRFAVALLIAFVSLGPSAAFAQTVECGPQPQFPPDADNSFKLDVEGKAQLLTKFLGDAGLNGKIETTKKELQQKHQNVDKAKINEFLLWVSCQNIMHDSSLNSAQKTMEFLQIYREIMKSEFVPPGLPKPSFALSFEKNEDVALINKGGPEENLAVKYVALAWVWINGSPPDKGCKAKDEYTLAPAIAVATGKTNGVVETYQVADIKKTTTMLPAILAQSGRHSCSYRIEYYVALSYDDRDGLQQQRYYRLIWAAIRGAPETRTCYKIGRDEFEKATASYETATRSGNRWSFSFEPQRVASFAAAIQSQPRGTDEREDDTVALEEQVHVIFHEPIRPCIDD
jgi:hypothetical protein